jgi:hypothetical protein
MKDRYPNAERTIFAVDKDGCEFEIRTAVGLPYETESGDWACPCALEGLHKRFPDMHGVDSWQSLILATRAIRNMLDYFIEQGGKLYWEKGGEEISVAELFDEREELVPDGPPTEDEQARIDNLTAEHIQMIDVAVIANASNQWRKVARVIGSAMEARSNTVPPVPDIFYSQRVRQLAAAGKLEWRGNLDYMRFNEIRLPGSQYPDDLSK